MSRHRVYPAYKESGVVWIGNVPLHWEIPALKYLLAVPITDGPHETPAQVESKDGVLFISAEAVSSGIINFKKAWGYISRADHERYSRKYKPQKGDVYMIKSGATTGVTAMVEDSLDFNIWSPLAAMRANSKMLPKFLLYALRSKEFQAGVTLNWSYGTQQNIGMNVLENLPLPIPPMTEQTAIVSTLDQENLRINALIQKKTLFIKLLKEKREALITHAVTRGLAHDVKMKDSGIEWIGEVPEHWEVKPLFFLTEVVKRKNTGLKETNILSLSFGKIIKKPENRNMGLVPESYETYQIVKPGEIVFRFTDLQNDKNSLRSAGVNEKGIITSAYLAVKPHGIHSTFMSWLMRSYDLCKVFYGMGAGLRQSLKFEDVKRLHILVPPQEEQIKIVKYINKHIDLIDELLSKTEQSIKLLKERRSAFITAAVTGQIDLRGEKT